MCAIELHYRHNKNVELPLEEFQAGQTDYIPMDVDGRLSILRIAVGEENISAVIGCVEDIDPKIELSFESMGKIDFTDVALVTAGYPYVYKLFEGQNEPSFVVTSSPRVIPPPVQKGNSI